MVMAENIARDYIKGIYFTKKNCFMGNQWLINRIERFWCAVIYYTREYCSYTIDGLRKNIPEAFKSISSATINRYYKHCCKIINAYNSGL
jgi:hypothetical protein